MPACAFTGHRPAHFVFKNDERHPVCIAIKDTIKNMCDRLYKSNGVRTFVNGCAIGSDMWCAEAVMQLRAAGHSDIRLICAVPFPEHTAKWTREQRERLDRIIGAANEVTYVCSEYSATAYKKRNYYMVDNAEYLIAVYNPAYTGRSGTGQTVRYAHKIERTIILVSPETGAFSLY